MAAVVTMVAATACLPLPPELAAAMCAPASTYVPDSVKNAPLVPFEVLGEGASMIPEPNAALMARLASWPVWIRVVAAPVVTVKLPAEQMWTAIALRKEFGDAIDIELGPKRLGGGPSAATESCLLEAPVWSFGQGVPRGVTATVTPHAPSFSRDSGVTANILVTNRTRRTIAFVSPMARRCDDPRGEALAPVGGALAANVAVGVPARDAPAPTGSGPALEWRNDGVGGVAAGWRRHFFVCPAIGYSPVTIPPGRSGSFDVWASTVSLQPGSDRFVTPGAYDLRVVLQMLPSTVPGTAPVGIALPPARVHLTD